MTYLRDETALDSLWLPHNRKGLTIVCCFSEHLGLHTPASITFILHSLPSESRGTTLSKEQAFLPLFPLVSFYTSFLSFIQYKPRFLALICYIPTSFAGITVRGVGGDLIQLSNANAAPKVWNHMFYDLENASDSFPTI